MTRYDFRMQRLFVEAPLHVGAEVAATPGQANYLLNVLRLGVGGTVLVFNGRDGEWRATISVPKKRLWLLTIQEETRPQQGGPDLHYLFAPLKRARLDYMVEKATEMGASVLQPVLTQHTQAERVNTDRMRMHVIEAAEQCGILRVPDVHEPIKLELLLRSWDGERRLIFCDEAAEVADPLVTLAPLRAPDGARVSVAILIGPEGGFSDSERRTLLAVPGVVRLALGPRILRADTAAVAAFAVVHAAIGDWR